MARIPKTALSVFGRGFGRGGGVVRKSPGGRETNLNSAWRKYGVVSLRSESESHCEEEECFGAKKPEKEEETKSHSNDLTKQRFSCLAGAFCRDHPCADVRASC